MKNNMENVNIENMIAVLDTNILLYMYKCSYIACTNLVQILRRLSNRIKIPNQVYCEYKSNMYKEQDRIDKKYDYFTKDLKKDIDRMKSGICEKIINSRKYQFPDCDELEKSITSLEEQLVKIIEEYQKKINIEKKNKENQIDEINELIKKFVEDKCIESELPLALKLKYIQEGEFRYKYKLPPGYMDEDKNIEKASEDNFDNRVRKFGDLFIWKEIIRIGKENPDKEIVFVTNDVKEDWWEINVKNGKKNPIRMREELYKEFVFSTLNSKIRFMTFEQFYSVSATYFNLDDIKTKLELEQYSFIKSEIIQNKRKTINKNTFEEIIKMNPLDIDEEYLKYDETEHIDNLKVNEQSLNFKDEMAIYNVVIEFEKEVLVMETRYNLECESALLNIVLNIQINRDIKDKKELDLKYNFLKINVLSEKEIDMDDYETEGKIELGEILEDYYMQ